MMKKHMAVDKGTTYMKTNEKVKFRSTVRLKQENEIDLNNKKIKVKYEGTEYVIGEKNQNFATDLEKADNEYTKLLILTAIALSRRNQENISTNLITGLPVGYYAKHKKKMKELFNEFMHEKITVNGKNYNIQIKKVKVFPEAAGAFYTQNHENGLVIDIGGLSVDVALFENREMIKFSTYKMGMILLYREIANMLNSRSDLNLSEWDIEKIIKKNGMFVESESRTLNLEELNVDILLKNHAMAILNKIKIEYDLKAIEHILFTGGGSVVLYKYFNMARAELLENAQINNVEGYDIVGDTVYA